MIIVRTRPIFAFIWLFLTAFSAPLFAQQTAIDPVKTPPTKPSGSQTACFDEKGWVDCKVDRVFVYGDRVMARCAGNTGPQQNVAVAKTSGELSEQFLSLASAAYLSGSILSFYRDQSTCAGATTGVPGCNVETCSRATAFGVKRP